MELLLEWNPLVSVPPMAIEATSQSDLLAQFLASQDAPESERLLARLLRELAEPVVQRIVGSRLSGPDAEDVSHNVMADLIARLREMKDAGGGLGTIRDFPAYAAVAAYHGCNECFRQCFPQRYRLRNRLRYLLLKDHRFALWESPGGEWLCGRKDGRRNQPAARQEVTDSGWASSREAARVVDSIFAELGAPMAFDDLIDRVAQHWGISDHPVPNEDLASADGAIDTLLERRSWLKRLWDEIGELPLRQRFALLLNLRDDQGGPALALFPVTGVATIRQIAAALDVAAGELARIWNELPLEDQRIAEWLGISRQQVINLRKAARERLSRRLA